MLSIRISNPFLAPEIRFIYSDSIKLYKNAKQILNNIYNNNLKNEDIKKSIIRYFDEKNIERENHMLNEINKYNPDIIIVGDGHAQRISKSLKDRYTYIRTEESQKYKKIKFSNDGKLIIN